MTYREIILLSILFYSDVALSQNTDIDPIVTLPNPDLSAAIIQNHHVLNTSPDTSQKDNASTQHVDTSKSAEQKPPKTSAPSIQKLQNLASISTQQHGNVDFDIKSANLIKGTNLTQLTNIKVTSFTRTEEKMSNVAAAMYVISNDEIKRMGVQHLADILRYVPGVAVVQAGANSWYIAVRGFNSSDSNKLLVLIDGRSIYSTLFGGVLWQEQDYPLEDIQRIEIIRGPGGVTWGSNAVNGVINIITKNSKDTQGTFFSAGGGNVNQLVEGRIGKQIAENTYGRFYIKTSHENRSSGIPIDDDGVMLQSGFRVDKLSTAIGNFTVSGDIFKGGIGPKLDGLQKQLNAEEYTGHNVLFNWSYDPNESRNHQFLTYVDYTNLNASGSLIDKRTTFHMEYQLTQNLPCQQFIGGLTYRRVSDSIPTIPTFQFIPVSRIDHTYGGFVQDDISFLANRAHFIIGTKYEDNNYTGAEWQPSVRGSYSFNPQSLAWMAWSRAVRVPTRLEEDLNFPPVFFGNTHLVSESASVYEAGWRQKWNQMSFDIAAFSSVYKNLETIEGTTEGNKMSGRVSGLELGPSFQLSPNWVTRVNYSFAISDLAVSKSSLDTSAPFLTENSYPRNMAEIVSMWDVNECWQLNTYLRYMDAVKVRTTPPNIQNVPSYIVADASVVWKPNKTVNWELVGRNLGKKHFEWGGPTVPKIVPSIALYLTVNLA